jgi:ABC-2 type transport system permease protein
MSTIYIIWLRQVKRFFRRPSRIIGSLGQPLLFLIALGLGLQPVFQAAGRGKYIQYLAPGIIAMSIMFNSVFSGIEIIWDRQFGFLKETLVAPVSRINIMLGRTLGAGTIAILQGVVVLIASELFGFRLESFQGFLLSLLIMFITSLLFASFGTAVATQLNDMQGFQLIMNFIIMPIFFLSGALFPLQGIPTLLKTIVSFNPLTYSVDALRGSLTGSYTFPFARDIAVLAVITLLFLTLGSYLFKKIQI